MPIKEPTNIEKAVIWIMKNNKVFIRVINEACGEAYEIGFRTGFLEGSAKHGKKYQKKVKKAMKGMYKA